MYGGGTVCTPSRATLMTGFHSGHTIVDRGDLNTLRAGNLDRTWGQVLQDAGYETGMFGKWHLGGFPLPGVHHALPTQKGFETAYGPMSGTYRSQNHFQSNGLGGMQAVQVPSDPTWPGPGGPFVYGEDLVANRATQFIRDKSVAGQPFAAYVAFIEPHTPHEMVPQDHPYVDKPWSKGLRDYAGLIHKLDQHVGQLMQAIDDPNGDGNASDSVANNTLLVFTSDNGPVWPALPRDLILSSSTATELTSSTSGRRRRAACGRLFLLAGPARSLRERSMIRTPARLPTFCQLSGSWPVRMLPWASTAVRCFPI